MPLWVVKYCKINMAEWARFSIYVKLNRVITVPKNIIFDGDNNISFVYNKT